MVEGRPIQILKVTEDHKFKLDVEALANIVGQESVKNLPVAVISISGILGKGKSFLLNFFLRYLRAEGKPGWIGLEYEILEGFLWKGGPEPHTAGIVAWSEIFMVNTPNGKIGVLILDTQGLYGSGEKETVSIFALSTLISSVQIYNLRQHIGENDLQHLQEFIEYGKLAAEAYGQGDVSNMKPFQNLLFLVRDWYHRRNAAYGLEGGEKILEKHLTVSKNEKNPEIHRIRNEIRKGFSKISCFLMPYPGKAVAQCEENTHLRLSQIELDFMEQLESLVPLILSPQSLVVKEIFGKKIVAQELLHYFEGYVKIFNGNELPEPKSVLEATAAATNLSASALAAEYYSDQMEKICGSEKSFLKTYLLRSEDSRVKQEALERFVQQPKFGGVEISQKYKEGLEQKIENTFRVYEEKNGNKGCHIL